MRDIEHKSFLKINVICQTYIRFYTFTSPISQFADTSYLKHLMINSLLKIHKGLFWENDKDWNKLRSLIKCSYFPLPAYPPPPPHTLGILIQPFKNWGNCNICSSNASFTSMSFKNGSSAKSIPSDKTKTLGYKLETQRKILIVFPIKWITFEIPGQIYIASEIVTASSTWTNFL